MTSSKDTPANRPPSSHRVVLGAVASSLPTRQGYGRAHSHSISLGSVNMQHRINRRKSSSSFAPNNMAALAAAVKEASMDGAAIPPRPKTMARVEGVISESDPSLTMSDAAAIPSDFASSHPNNGSSAIIDGPPFLSILGNEKVSAKARARRASEGSRLTKAEGRKQSGSELRCDTCGKGYKHGSCLTKHLWEHDPAWSVTSKLLISKHQQVQLLEAASVLIKMQDGTTVNESTSALDSDFSSNSPDPSGSSDLHEDVQSSRSSSPPQVDDQIASSQSTTIPVGRVKRKDSYSSAFSQSYRSTSAHSFAASSMPNDFSNGPWTPSSRPSTAGGPLNAKHENEVHADIAAAAEGLLSCSLGTPKYGPTALSPEIPPVPPLPAKFAHANHYSAYRTKSDDIHMDDDEGVFGQME